MHTGVCQENLKQPDYVEGVVIDGRILLKWILKEYDGWALTTGLMSRRDRNKWWPVLNMVMNFQVPENVAN